ILAALNAPASARAEAGTAAVAWGDNVYMELGAGYKNLQEERPVTAVGLSNITDIALGYHFDVALLGDGTVDTWGGNAFGQLGNGTVLAWGKNDAGQLGTGKVGPLVCKTEIGEVPCNPTPEPVVLANGEPLRDVKAIDAGKEAAYALLSSGHVMGWGSNGRGQVGNGSLANSDVAVEAKGLSNVV